jgi:hypothetical protein
METIIKTRKPRTVKPSAPRIAEMKRAMSAALKAEHAFFTAATKIEKRIAEYNASVKAKREAVIAAWGNVKDAAIKCSVAYNS